MAAVAVCPQRPNLQACPPVHWKAECSFRCPVTPVEILSCGRPLRRRTVFKYLWEMAIQYREHATMLCIDDKHHCKVGEPGYPLAAVERGRRVLVAVGKTFAVGDHDFAKCSLIPSVALLCNIPEEIGASFFQGQVNVGLKDAAFEASSPLRHATELSALLKVWKVNRPVLFLYSDGGPDHRVTYLSTKLSLIALFLEQDLDCLVAVRTPPHNSWRNPVERAMSLLNLAMQSVGLMRSSCGEKYEKVLRSCNSLAQIRAAAEKDPGLKTAILDAMQQPKSLLSTLFSRLKLKGTDFGLFPSAEDTEMDGLFTSLSAVDPAIQRDDHNQSILRHRPQLRKFMDHCCQSRWYSFSIKRCGQSACSICKAPRLPAEVFATLYHLPDPVPDETGEHYRPFQQVYSQKTTEQHRPSLAAGNQNHGMPFSPTAQTAKTLARSLIAANAIDHVCCMPRGS